MEQVLNATTQTSPTTETPQTPGWVQNMLFGLAGPAAIGACLGVHLQLEGLFLAIIALPLLMLGLGIITLPGLYIGAAVMGQEIQLGDLARVALKAFDAMGVMMLGVAPAVLFMSVSNASNDETIVVASAAMALGALLGFRSFCTNYWPYIKTTQQIFPIALWILTTVGLGRQLYMEILRMAGGL